MHLRPTAASRSRSALRQTLRWNTFATRHVSAGALEMFAACPVKWLIERQLRADARDLNPDPKPLARGSFVRMRCWSVSSPTSTGRSGSQRLPTQIMC